MILLGQGSDSPEPCLQFLIGGAYDGRSGCSTGEDRVVCSRRVCSPGNRQAACHSEQRLVELTAVGRCGCYVGHWLGSLSFAFVMRSICLGTF